MVNEKWNIKNINEKNEKWKTSNEKWKMNNE
jgi:hypothetical protein